MKTYIPALLVALSLQLASSAAPRVVISSPSLEPESQIDLVLDSPAVAITEVGSTTAANSWLTIQPDLPGKLTWKSQTLASFTPDRSPAIGTRYTFAIPPGLKLLDGTPVTPGTLHTAQTSPFEVRTTTILGRWEDDYKPSRPRWLVIFNDTINPAAASSLITFTSKEGLTVPATAVTPTASEAGHYATAYPSWSDRTSSTARTTPPAVGEPVPHLLIVTPATALTPSASWSLEIPAGLPNLANNAKTTQRFTTHLGEIKPFIIEKIQPVVIVNQPRRIVIDLSEIPDPLLPEDFLTRNLTIAPRPANLSATIERSSICLSGDFSQDEYSVTLNPPLSSAGGLPLATSKSASVNFERIEPSVALPSTTAAQLANGNRTYQILTTNISSLRIRVRQLTGTDLLRAYEGYRSYTGRGHNGEPVEPTSPLPYTLVAGETLVDKEILLDNPIDTSREVTLAWDELLPPGLRNAAIFIDVTGTPHPQSNAGGRRNAQALLQLTDIGLAWKFTPSSAFIYAFSCHTGAPLPNVQLEQIGEDAKLISSSSTDANGLATIDRPATLQHLRATLGKDSFILPFDTTLATVGLWHFPVRYSWSSHPGPARQALLFTDRSLYRPGETVRLKGILRNLNGNAIEPPSSGAARITILDPAENEIFTTPVTFSPQGSFDLSYTLPPSKTGTHSLRLEFPEELAAAAATEDNWSEQNFIENNARFSIPLRVEEFRRNAFEIKQDITPAEQAATSLSVTLAANYYQGQPVAAGSVRHFSRITQENLYPDRFRDFLFGNHRQFDDAYWYHYFGYRVDDESNAPQASQVQGETTLTPAGTATLAVEIPQSDFPTGRKITVSSEVSDANHQTLTSTVSATVHPASVYVGISRHDSLARAGTPVRLKLVAVNPEGNPCEHPVRVTATTTREVHSVVKTRTAAGATTTRDNVSEETVATSEIVIDPAASAADGADFTFTPLATGKHYITLRGTDPSGRAFATQSYLDVYGTSEFPWLYEDGLRIKIVAEKKSYKPGETARLLVLTPIEGTALVTVEREKVLRSFQVPLKADHPVIEVPLSAEDAPNAFVSVLIVKGARESARDHKEPQLRLGYAELIVENLRDALAVELDTPSESGVRPGQDHTLSGRVTLADGKPAAGAEVTLYAEDEGTLAVMGYETPRPHDFFYRPRQLDVETGTSFESFIAEDPEQRDFFNKGFFIGGGGDLAKLAEMFRKNFDPCATWAPALVTDADGRFSHSFRIPDTLTRYRVIAVAHHGSHHFGTGESSLVAKKDLMLEPQVPRFANVSDALDTRVLVQNASSHAGTWEISIATATSAGTTPAVTTHGALTQTVSLEPGASTSVVFPITAELTGEAVLRWAATPVSLRGTSLTPDLTRSLSDAVENRFPILYPVPLLRQSTLVKLDEGTSTDLMASVDPNLKSGRGTIDLEFARSPLVEAGTSLDFLLSYPHGCIEQTSSSLIPWLTADSLRPYLPSLAKKSEAEVAAAIQAGADRLLSMQLPEGNFSYWPGSTEPVAWATSYAGMALVMARQEGAAVPDSAIEKLTQHLVTTLSGAGEETSPSQLEQHARTLLTLSLAGTPQAAYLNLLRDRLTLLTPAARALLAAAIALADPDDETALESARALLTQKLTSPPVETHWAPPSTVTACELLAWSAAYPTSPEPTRALDRLLNDRSAYRNSAITWLDGWSMLALAAYADTQAPADTSTTLAITTPAGSHNIRLDAEIPTASQSFPLTPDLVLNASTTHPALVRVKVASQPAITPLQPVSSNGMAIDRTYKRVNPDGTRTPLQQPAVGDLIEVSLLVSLPQDSTQYLAIVDLLPATFEAINDQFTSQRAAVGIATSTQDWQISHSELRSDRACFYLDQIPHAGTYNITYLARCTLAGKATAPPAKVEAMYDPSRFALSSSQIMTSR